MPKRLISIIGSNSFLAQHLAIVLKEDKNSVIHGYAKNNINPNVDIFSNFVFPSAIPTIDELCKSDVIIFTAGNGIQADKKVDDYEILELNSFYPIRLMTSLSNNGFCGQFYSFGSYAEIGVSKRETPYREIDIVSSQNLVHNQYTVSKRLLTNFVSNSLISNYKFYHIILPTIYGKGENPLRLIPYLLDCYSTKSVAKLTSGDQVRQYLHVNDASKYVKGLIDNKEVNSGILNLGSKDIFSVKEVVGQIEMALDIKIEVNYGSAKRSDIVMAYIANDDQKIKSIVNLENRVSFEEGIQGYLR